MKRVWLFDFVGSVMRYSVRPGFVSMDLCKYPVPEFPVMSFNVMDFSCSNFSL